MNLSLPFSFHLPSFLTNNPIYRNETARITLFTIGASYALFKTLSHLKNILSPFFEFEPDIAKRYGQGTWAVITGASDGIGRTFSFELAKRGFNIALVGRDEEKLKRVVQEIKLLCPDTQTRVIVADFSHSYEPDFAEKIFNQVKDVNVSILINNAGVSYKSYFHETPIDKVRELVLTNALAHALIIRAFLPTLAKRTGRSAIINTSSLAGSSPRPYVQLYSAAKAFHDYLSRGLVYEHPNIDIISVKPGTVTTKMTNYKPPGIKTITPEEYVKATLCALGRHSHTYGHWKHRLDGYIVDNCPNFLKPAFYRNRYDM